MLSIQIKINDLEIETIYVQRTAPRRYLGAADGPSKNVQCRYRVTLNDSDEMVTQVFHRYGDGARRLLGRVLENLERDGL